MNEPAAPRTVGIVLYEGFELLDVFGPAEMFGLSPDLFRLQMLATAAGPVTSAQGPQALADVALADASGLDILLVPGGIGSRRAVEDTALLDTLRRLSDATAIVTSVCTGAALLARAGVLDGRRATTNKWAFAWVAEQGPVVDWIRQARWVVDGKYWTSSGVTAGIDMSLALIEHLHGRRVAEGIAIGTEYERATDPGRDPFAAYYAHTRGTDQP